MRAFFAFPLLAIATPAAAQFTPLPPPPSYPFGTAETRVRSLEYVTDQVFRLQAAPGFQLTVELAQDEQVENVAVGDSGAWQVAVNRRGNRLFIKPLMADVMTNMVVITDARVYSFELAPGEADAPEFPYIVRFRYPAAGAAATDVPRAVDSQRTPARYKLRGDKALRPLGMHDDGVHTYIDWPEDRPLSAIYAINENGQEALVNSSVRGAQIVIDSVYDRVIFRRDKERATATRIPEEVR